MGLWTRVIKKTRFSKALSIFTSHSLEWELRLLSTSESQATSENLKVFPTHPSPKTTPPKNHKYKIVIKPGLNCGAENLFKYKTIKKV